MNLIPMTDFLEQNLKTGCLSTQLQIIHKYKEFLKQTTNKGMFVPCDEDGNVLVNDNFTEYDREMYFEEEQKYQQAKERCLFKGINSVDFRLEETHIQFTEFKKEDEYYNLTIFNKNATIEDLVNYKLPLTETAIKQLGLSDN